MKKEKKEGEEEEEAGVEVQVNEEEREVDHEDMDLRKVRVAAVGANQRITDEMREITKVNPKNMETKDELLKRRAMMITNTMVNINQVQEVTN